MILATRQRVTIILLSAPSLPSLPPLNRILHLHLLVYLKALSNSDGSLKRDLRDKAYGISNSEEGQHETMPKKASCILKES